MKNKQCIFYSLPVAAVEIPSPAFSVLKAYLEKNLFQVKINYWNILFQKYRKSYQSNAAVNTQNDTTELLLPLSPFLCYLAKKYKDKKVIEKILYLLKISYPEMIIKDTNFYNSIIYQQFQVFISLIKEKIKNNNNVLLNGFCARYNQWLPALVCADIIKEIKPDQPIVIGGFDSKEEALSFMKMSKDFDFAIWGEGEIPLLKLCNEVKNGTKNFNTIPRLIYRKDLELISSKVASTCSSYVDLNEIVPNFNDYFNYIEEYNLGKESIFLPIENARGCKWNKCKFCFINTGYHYRGKKINKIIEEIARDSTKYSIFNFIFVSSDLVGFEYNNFNDFLSMLMELTKNNGFEFNFVGEIIPKNISEFIIKKMALLNFTIQIGYESTSDSLLAKMNKCTRFADLIFFVKFAQKYGLKIQGANVITNILEEKESDVIEAIHNLPFLRFFLGEQGFVHKKIPLNIKKGSIFYTLLSKKQKSFWIKNTLVKVLPKKIIANMSNRFEFFPFASKYIKNSNLWDDFFYLNEYYEKTKFYYKIIEENNIITYKEYANNMLVKSIIFDDSLYIDILKETNSKIESIKNLLKILSKKHKNLTEKQILSCITRLKEEYLIYYNENIEKSIVSVIDIIT